MTTSITAQELNVGEQARLIELDGPPTFLSRLRELGFIPGMQVICQSSTPFGDPRTYAVGPITVALRREEAKCLKLQR